MCVVDERDRSEKRRGEKTGNLKFVLGIELFDLFKNLSTLATATQRHWWSGRSIEYGIRLLLTQTSEKPKIKQKSLLKQGELESARKSTPNRVKHDPRLHVQLIILSRIGYLSSCAIQDIISLPRVCVAIARRIYSTLISLLCLLSFLGVKKFVRSFFFHRLGWLSFTATHNFINTVKVRLNREIGFLSLNLVI